jgi:hypothetical protein
MGGRVSLFNYNPSIAGGKIAIKRYARTHPMGRILRGNHQKNMVVLQGAEQGSGLAPPGHHIGGLMGAAPKSSMHASKDAKKRVLDCISEHLAGGRTKRMRS